MNSLLSRLSQIYQQVKDHYLSQGNSSSGQVEKISSTIEEEGYLPVPFEVACDELSPAAIFAGLEALWEKEGTWREGDFAPAVPTNPLWRHGYGERKDNSWLRREQHKIESISLMGLTESSPEGPRGFFLNYLIKILTAPPGNPYLQIPATTFYVLPFFQRDEAFQSAYCPSRIDVDHRLADRELEKSTGLTGEDQIKLFFALAQKAGHPILMDLLPQTGRYSQTLLARPHCFRWYYLPELVMDLELELSLQASSLRRHLQPSHHPHLARAVGILKADLRGEPLQTDNLTPLEAFLRSLYHDLYREIPLEIKEEKGNPEGVSLAELKEKIIGRFHSLHLDQRPDVAALSQEDLALASPIFSLLVEVDFALMPQRKALTDFQLSRKRQAQFSHYIREIIGSHLSTSNWDERHITEDKQQAIIEDLQDQGFWPVAGGGWNSAGHPIFHRLSPQSSPDNRDSYPVADHFHIRGGLVNAYAGDMDIVSPWYFAWLEKSDQPSNLNLPVMEEYVQNCLRLWDRFQPNGFRIDHLDHSADFPISVNSRGNPISYRAPLEVFSLLNRTFRSQKDPAFVLFAEYMGWGDERGPHLYGPYAKAGIQVAISTDVVGEYRQNARVVVEEGNRNLAVFNYGRHWNDFFSTTRVLDNHDRSHPDILPALSEFTPERALLKWVKCLFLTGGPWAPRPVLYLDGNQCAGTNQAFVDTFLEYKSLQRGKKASFFHLFQSLLQFSLREPCLLEGVSVLLPLSQGAERNNRDSAWLTVPLMEEDGLYRKDPTARTLLVVAREFIDDKTSPPPLGRLRLPLEGLKITSELELSPLETKGRLEDFLAADSALKEIGFPSRKGDSLFQWSDKLTLLTLEALKANEFRIFSVEAMRH